MAVDISLAQFNRIASGAYNAGFVDFAVNDKGEAVNALRKVNNHVFATGKNREVLSPVRILEVKEAFIGALEKANVSQEHLNLIRQKLGIAKEIAAVGDTAQLGELMTARFKPLTRQQVRELLDTYADGGRGFTDASKAAVSEQDAAAAQRTAKMSKGNRQIGANTDRMNLEVALSARGDHEGFRLTDVMSVLSSVRSFADLSKARQNRIAGDDATGELNKARMRDLGSGIATLFAAALGMLAADKRESNEVMVLGTPLKLVKGEDGTLSALVGTGAAQAKVTLDIDAERLVERLSKRAAGEVDAIGGGSLVKAMLNAAFAADVKKGLMVSDRTSLTRNFAARILEAHGKGTLAPNERGLVCLDREDYNTRLLVQIAQSTLDGEFKDDNVLDTREKLKAYYEKLREGSAALSDDIKHLLEGVADLPLERPNDGELIVRAPIVGNIQAQVDAMPKVQAPPPLPKDLTLTDIKDFVADFIFSNDTMVSDVVINLPGEMMRRMLSEPKRLAAFIAVLKSPALLDSAAASQIAPVLKAGFAKMAKDLDPHFKAATGVALADALADDGFDERFAAFFRDANKLPGEVLAAFDTLLDDMSTEACLYMQAFINEVFDIKAEGGVNVVSDPYSKMSVEDIKKHLDGKSLNDILDAAAKSEVPGQVGFFKQIVSTYFTSLDQSDKRACLAAALRYANVFDFSGLQTPEAIASARRVALNKFTGAILKGTGPLLQKMMQGLPKDIIGDYADALEDMKQHLAPIPRKIVQAHFMNIIKASKGTGKELAYIKLEKSLGAASVGEAFLCKIGIKRRAQKIRLLDNDAEIKANGGNIIYHERDAEGNPIYEDLIDTYSVVIKIMRHDAKRRAEKENTIFKAAAANITGMSKTWEGQYRQFQEEFDFTKEKKNIEDGQKIYNICGAGGELHNPMMLVAPCVTSMSLSDHVPSTKDVLVADVMDGDTVDEFFKEAITKTRQHTSEVFEQDPVTGRIKWETKVDPQTQKVTRTPVLRPNIRLDTQSDALMFLRKNKEKLKKASDKILQATKIWFYNALIGDGKFHGDAHSGNLMVTKGKIGFIDFGNLYKLEKARTDGVNEQQQLLRVILGAAFRDKSFLLTGFKALMSAEGKELIEKEEILAKATAILDAVLTPTTTNSFSFNIVYRLQAAIVELQKLGLELPPQINCFIQSLVRLSNSVTEINTIANQTKELIDALESSIDIPVNENRPANDYIGRVMDCYGSKAGRQPVRVREMNNEYVRVAPGDEKPDDVFMPGYMQLLQSREFGGITKHSSFMFGNYGEYSKQIVGRLTAAEDPIAEARKIADEIVKVLDPENKGDRKKNVDTVKAFTAWLADSYRAVVPFLEKSPQAAKGIFEHFANTLSREMGSALGDIQLKFKLDLNAQARDKDDLPPSTFASAITDILFDYFEALRSGLDLKEKMILYKDAYTVATGELHAEGVNSVDAVVDAIKADAQKIGGDNSYKIDIGV